MRATSYPTSRLGRRSCRADSGVLGGPLRSAELPGQSVTAGGPHRSSGRPTGPCRWRCYGMDSWGATRVRPHEAGTFAVRPTSCALRRINGADIPGHNVIVLRSPKEGNVRDALRAMGTCNDPFGSFEGSLAWTVRGVRRDEKGAP